MLPQVLNTTSYLANTIYPMLTIVLYRLLPQVFDSNGELIFSFGTNGEGNGQFNAPTGVAVLTFYYNLRKANLIYPEMFLLKFYWQTFFGKHIHVFQKSSFFISKPH